MIYTVKIILKNKKELLYTNIRFIDFYESAQHMSGFICLHDKENKVIEEVLKYYMYDIEKIEIKPNC